MAELTWENETHLQIINIIVYFLFLGSNIYTAAALGSYEDVKETFLTPSPYAYIIWLLIHLLLLGTIVYQFTAAGKRVIINGISWSFPLLSVLSASYIYLWSTHHYAIAFVFSLFVSSVVTHIYHTIKKHYPPQSALDEVYVHLPFSLYHGWTTVLVVLTAFEIFGEVPRNEIHPWTGDYSGSLGIWTKVFVILALFFLECTAATYAFFTSEGDLPAAVAITWYLFALFEHTRFPFIHWSSLAFACSSLLWVLKGAWGLNTKTRGRIMLDDQDRAPLLGS